jgi:uncharacterized protein with PIN domain
VRFVVDGMLGRLARWLRLTGHDVVYVNELPLRNEEQDDFLISRAAEGFILLTADRRLYQRSRRRGLRAALVQPGDLLAQLLELSKAVPGLEVDLENSRCPVCNGELQEVSPGEVGEEVPPSVRESQKVFWRCTSCGKVYWRGSHWEKILETLEEFRRRRLEAHA